MAITCMAIPCLTILCVAHGKLRTQAMFVPRHAKMWFVQTCNGDNYTFLVAPCVDMYGTVKLYVV